MGLFDRSPAKKLAKAQELLENKRYFDALRLFDEVIPKSAGEERTAAEEGSRACRREMISQRLSEAEAFCQAGDLDAARDRCQTALDLAGDDLPTDAIQEQMRRIDAPRRPVGQAGPSAGLRDLLPDPDEVVAPQPTPLDRAPKEAEGLSDEELFGEGSEEVFEIHLHTLDPDTAEFYRGLGEDFRFAFLALSQGEGKRALEFLERLDTGVKDDPRIRLEHAQALLLAGKAEESLDLLESLAAVPEGVADARAPERPPRIFDEGRRRFLLVDAYRALHRHEDAVAAALSLADATGGASPAAESLLAWSLLEAGQPQEAYDRLQKNLPRWADQDEILIPAAQAAVSLDQREEAISLLEELIRIRVHRSLARENEVDFPVEAGRRLLHLYVETDHDPEEIRGLVLRLLDYDPERGEQYRDMLMRLDQAG